MTDVLALLKRYNEPTPRYTSYPPAPNWRAAHRGLLISALRRSTAPQSIYVHIPCSRIRPAGRLFVRAVAKVFDAFQSPAIAAKAV